MIETLLEDKVKEDNVKVGKVPQRGKLCITLAGRGETGKSVLGASLAYSFAKQGLNVVYVDQFDAQRIHRYFHLKPETQRHEDETPGGWNDRVKQEIRLHEAELQDFLENAKTMDDYWGSKSCDISELLQETNPPTENLHYIIGSKTSESTNYQKRKKLFKDILKFDADVIIFDGTPGYTIPVIDAFLGYLGEELLKKTKDDVKKPEDDIEIYHQGFITVDTDPSSADEIDRFIRSATYRGIEKHFANSKNKVTPKKKSITRLAKLKEKYTKTSVKLKELLEKTAKQGKVDWSDKISVLEKAVKEGFQGECPEELDFWDEQYKKLGKDWQKIQEYKTEVEGFSAGELIMLKIALNEVSIAERTNKTIDGLEVWFEQLQENVEKHKVAIIGEFKNILSENKDYTYNDMKYKDIEELMKKIDIKKTGVTNSKNGSRTKELLLQAIKENLVKDESSEYDDYLMLEDYKEEQDIENMLFKKDKVLQSLKEVEIEELFPLHSKHFNIIKDVLKNFGKEYPRINFVITKAPNEEKAAEIEKGLIQKLNHLYGTTFVPSDPKCGIYLNSNRLISDLIPEHDFYYPKHPDSIPAKLIDKIRNRFIKELGDQKLIPFIDVPTPKEEVPIDELEELPVEEIDEEIEEIEEEIEEIEEVPDSNFIEEEVVPEGKRSKRIMDILRGIARGKTG